MADLCIAIDSSGSMRQIWNTSLDFSLELLRRLNISAECVRVSMVSFGTEGYLYSLLAGGTSLQQVTGVVTRMRGQFKNEWTNTGAAIKLMTDQVFAVARENVAKIGLIITDGPSNREREQTLPNAQVSESSQFTSCIMRIAACLRC